jgi:GNAT superfamily N-acetyltransferase
MPLPPTTEELARRLASAGIAFMTEGLEGIARLPGNPRRLRIERFGAAIAPASTAQPELDFMNRVMGLYPEDAGRVADILAYYRDLGIRPWVELAPAMGFESLAAALTEGGAAQIGFHTVLYGRAETPEVATPPPGVEVRTIDAAEIGAFSDTLLRGFELPEEALKAAVRDHSHWAEVDGWHLYLATVDGEPAAGAALTVGDGIGLLANAATVPAFRGRGCQTALILRRIADAAAAGCELMAGEATFASSSHRNMERAGLRVAFTNATWRVREVPAASPSG